MRGVCGAGDQAGELGGVGLALEAGWGWEPQQMRLCHLPARHHVPGEPLLKSCGYNNAAVPPPRACLVPSRSASRRMPHDHLPAQPLSSGL